MVTLAYGCYVLMSHSLLIVETVFRVNQALLKTRELEERLNPALFELIFNALMQRTPPTYIKPISV